MSKNSDLQGMSPGMGNYMFNPAQQIVQDSSFANQVGQFSRNMGEQRYKNNQHKDHSLDMGKTYGSKVGNDQEHRDYIKMLMSIKKTSKLRA